MSQSLKIAPVEIYLCDTVNNNGFTERYNSVTENRYSFRSDITGSQWIEIVSGEILLCHSH